MGVPGNVKIAGPYLTTGRATVKIFWGPVQCSGASRPVTIWR